MVIYISVRYIWIALSLNRNKVPKYDHARVSLEDKIY